MIPILFNYTETAFTSQGLGRLIDARLCEITEERNGEYELVLEYPTRGPLFDKLVPGNYILATHDESGDEEPFEIYETSAPLDGWMTVRAWHISYKLNRIVVEPFTAVTCATALAGLGTNSMNTNPFTFTTDKTTNGSFAPSKPASVRSLLGGTSGSILDVYGGGEYEFKKYSVKLWAARGSNTGVTIRYGKNLKTLNYELDASNVYNAVVPFWQNDETTVYVDHVVVRTGETAKGVIPLDLSSDWDEAPTTAELETAAQAYIDASENYVVKDNIKIDFVQLWKTEEYKNLASLQTVKLCDTVTVYYEKFGINATAKVIKVVFNTLLDRFDSMELGEPQTTLSQQIQADVSGGILAEVPSIATRMLSSISFSTSGDITANNLASTSGLTVGGNATVAGTLTVNDHKVIGVVQENTTAGTAKTFTIPSNSRHLLCTAGAIAERCAMYIVTANSSGAVIAKAITTGTSVTESRSTNSITITISGGAGTVTIFNLGGSLASAS